MRSGWLVIFFVSITECHRHEHEKKFLYFAYGSNLLKTRLRINAPSAVFITPARLPGYRLDFDNYSPNWRGAPATIAAIPKGEVWGALWLLNYSEMGALDEQEGLKDGLYEAIDVKVLNLNNHVITARSYKMTSDPPKVHPEVLPLQRRPSNTYIQVIALGAYQCGIPSYYIEFIYRFPTNGRTATDKLSQELGYPFNENIQISLKYFFVFLKNNNGPFITSFGTTRYLCSTVSEQSVFPLIETVSCVIGHFLMLKILLST